VTNTVQKLHFQTTMKWNLANSTQPVQCNLILLRQILFPSWFCRKNSKSWDPCLIRQC